MLISKISVWKFYIRRRELIVLVGMPLTSIFGESTQICL